jgi:hypothetical protein
MAPSPSPVIPDWRRVERCHPRSSQIGVDFSNSLQFGVQFRASFVPFVLKVEIFLARS